MNAVFAVLKELTPEETFNRRIQEIHRTQSWATAAGGESVGNVHHQELEAMFRSFLGPHYDREAFRLVCELQDALREDQSALARRLKVGVMTPGEYVAKFNDALASTFNQCEQVLGAATFIQVFGGSPSEMAGFIDPAIFLSNEPAPFLRSR